MVHFNQLDECVYRAVLVINQNASKGITSYLPVIYNFITGKQNTYYQKIFSGYPEIFGAVDVNLDAVNNSCLKLVENEIFVSHIKNNQVLYCVRDEILKYSFITTQTANLSEVICILKTIQHLIVRKEITVSESGTRLQFTNPQIASNGRSLRNWFWFTKNDDYGLVFRFKVHPRDDFSESNQIAARQEHLGTILTLIDLILAKTYEYSQDLLTDTSWKGLVIFALKRLGGVASLNEIYKYVLHLIARDERLHQYQSNKDPKSTISGILQRNNSKDGIFEHISEPVWKLK